MLENMIELLEEPRRTLSNQPMNDTVTEDTHPQPTSARRAAE